MATLAVYDQSGNEVGTYEIDTDKIAKRVSKQLLHDAVVMYQANQRQGSHNTRTRGQVAGSKKKMYRQKPIDPFIGRRLNYPDFACNKCSNEHKYRIYPLNRDSLKKAD